MDNFMHRGGRMLGSSKLYGTNRPQDNEWRFSDSRMQDASRPCKDSQIQESPRQFEDLRMQDSRLFLESGMEQNYSPPRMYDVSEVQGSVRIPDRVHGGSQLHREVRAYQDSRIESCNRLEENSRIYDVSLQDHMKPRSNAVAYDYNHRRSDDVGSFKDMSTQSKFMTSHENIRTGRRSYPLEENDSVKQGFLDILPNTNSLKKNLDILSAKSCHGFATTGSSHILTPSLTSSSGPPTGDGIRPIGNRDSYPKGKSSKAFDYLKTWRLKMNMPTDAFLLEKEGVGNQQQGIDAMPPHTHDDWYTQPPAAEPRRASIDPEWNCSGSSFAEKEAYGERPGNKYGNVRYSSYGESLAGCPKDQGLESDRTGNPPWKWDEELPSGQNLGAKRNYDSMSAGQNFNHAHRDSRFLHDTVQTKRPRFSPSIMQGERGGTVEQYTSIIPEQENISQNVMDSDDTKFKIGVNNSLYGSQSAWISPFHSKPLMDSSKFSRSCDIGSEGVGSRHKLMYGDVKGVVARERSQPSYTHSRDLTNVSHLNTERSPDLMGRHKYSEPQDRPSRLPVQGVHGLDQDPLDQERPPNEMFMSSAPYSLEMSPRSYHGIRSHRSPVRIKSPGIGVRGKSPSFSRRKSQTAVPRGKYSDPNTRDRSSPWRKGRSPGPGRDRAPRPERGRSPGPAGLEASAGRLPGLAGRQRLSVLTGRQRSPSTQELPGVPKRERSPELARRVKSSGSGRGRSPGHQIRERSPGSTRRERLPASPGRGRILDRERWRSPGRSPGHMGKEKSPKPFRRERPLGSSERGKSPALLGKGRSHVISSAGDRSHGPLGGQSSGPLERGRSTGKSHAGRRGSPGASEKGKLQSGMSSKPGRDKSPGPERIRSSGTSGRTRSPGAGGRDRSPRFPGKGKQADAPGRRRSPRLLVSGKPSKTVKGGSAEQRLQRSVSPTTGVSFERKVAKGEQASSSHYSRGRSPMKGRSPVGTGIRSESFFDGKQRPMMERFPRIRSRSPLPPVKRNSSDHREKTETLVPNEYRDYRMEKDRSPYLEEVSLSPRSSRFWSSSGRTVMNMRSHHSRERSLSVDALQRACSPVSVQSEDNPHRTVYPQESFFPDRGGYAPQEHPSHIYPNYSPPLVDGYISTRKNDLEVESSRTGRQQERLYSLSREVSFSTGRQSVEKVHNTKCIWREDNKDRGGQHFSSKKGSGKTSDVKDEKSASSSKYAERPEGTLLEEEVDDEDLRIHLLRLREQKVEMKLMKLEEESKETEMKLLELKKNQTGVREASPTEEERRHTDKEPFRPHGRRHETYPWKHQHSASPQRERYHRQHKRF